MKKSDRETMRRLLKLFQEERAKLFQDKTSIEKEISLLDANIKVLERILK